MIYRMEVYGDSIAKTEFRTSDRKLERFAHELCEFLGLDDSRVYIDVVLEDLQRYNDEGGAVLRYAVTSRGVGLSDDDIIDASAVRLSHVTENIGDEMILCAGYDSICIRLKGIVFG